MATLRTSVGASNKRKTCNKFHWTHLEDNILTGVVQMYGAAKWDRIAAFIPGRSGKSCRIRWLNQLHPNVDKKPFSAEEKQRLLRLHREFGNKWSIITSYFPGRTDNQVKNQYHILAGTRHKKGAGSSPSNDPHGSVENGSGGLSQYHSISMNPVGSQFSDVTSRETNHRGSAPLFSAMPGRVAMRCSSNGGGSSSVYAGQGGYSTEVWESASILTSLASHPRQTKYHGDSMFSDANSAGIQGHNYIDFLGVGSSN